MPNFHPSLPCSVRRGSRHLRVPHHLLLHRPDLHHAARLALLRRQSRAGVRARRHLPARPAAQRRRPRPGHLLHRALRRLVPKGRHEDAHLRRTAAGGELRTEIRCVCKE